MLDRSGSPPVTPTAGAGWAAVAPARASSALRMRPVRTIPATKPEVTKMKARRKRLIMVMLDAG
jgi:hypothetical protein